MNKKGLSPVVDPQIRVLILGSMPSEMSLQQGQYYANPRNQLWKILSAVLAVDFPEDYEGRLRCLRRQRIGLWDVIAACERNGSSLDSAIKSARINDFENFFFQCRHLKVIGCNGGLAYKLFTRHVDARVPVVKLPSSSPAHTVPLPDKVAVWRKGVGMNGPCVYE